MTLTDLEAFNEAIKLAESNDKLAAHTILTHLRQTNPDNSRVLVCYAFTAPDPRQAQIALEIALALEPANPTIRVALEWLARQDGPSSFQQERAYSMVRPVEKAVASGFVAPNSRSKMGAVALEAVSNSNFNCDRWSGLAQPGPASLPTRGSSVEQTSRKDKSRSTLKASQLVGYAGLLAMAVALTLLLIFHLLHDLNPEEQSYWQAVNRLNLRSNAANARLQELGKPGKGQEAPPKEEVRRQLEVWVGLYEDFKGLHSPSPRFERVDGLLGLAYNYYSEGATFLLKSLDQNDSGLTAQGNALFASGNSLLSQARQELAALGFELART